MANLSTVIQTLNRKLESGSIYSAWLKFTAGELAINTYTDKNIFVSMENVKNGVGQANTFSISLAYVPFARYTESRFGDINYVDRCLFNNKTWECEIQYGYSFGTDNLITPVCKGMITGYDTDIREGMLWYTIKGYSSLVPIGEDKVIVEDMASQRATDAAKSVLETYLLPYGYTVEIDPTASGRDEVQDVISGTTDKSLFDYVNTLLKSTKDSTKSPDNIISSPIYSYVIDDVNKVVKIIRIDPSAGTSSAEVTFNWMDKSNSMVTSFTPKYNGIVLMSYSRTKRTSVDSGAETTETNVIKEETDVGDYAESDANIELSKWIEAARSLPMTATMITLGIPYDIPITTKITINPLIYGQKHISAGTYMVTKTTDIIDSNGFTTTLELMKISPFVRLSPPVDASSNVARTYNIDMEA